MEFQDFETIQPKEANSRAEYDPNLVTWVNDSAGYTAIIDGVNLCSFAAKSGWFDGSKGWEIAKRLECNAENPDLWYFVYFDPKTQQPIGLYADRFTQMVDEIGSHQLDVKGIGPFRLRLLREYAEKLHKPAA